MFCNNHQTKGCVYSETVTVLILYHSLHPHDKLRATDELGQLKKLVLKTGQKNTISIYWELRLQNNTHTISLFRTFFQKDFGLFDQSMESISDQVREKSCHTMWPF